METSCLLLSDVTRKFLREILSQLWSSETTLNDGRKRRPRLGREEEVLLGFVSFLDRQVLREIGSTGLFRDEVTVDEFRSFTSENLKPAFVFTLLKSIGFREDTCSEKFRSRMKRRTRTTYQ